MKIRIIYDTHGWAYYHRARIIQEFAPSDMEITIAPYSERFTHDSIDLLFDMNYGQTGDVRRLLNVTGRHKTIFLTSFNRGWPERKEYFYTALNDAHAMVVNNRRYWDATGQLPSTYHISNGVDRQVFTNRVAIGERKPKVLWVGSDYHRGTKNYDQLLVPLVERLRANLGVTCDFYLSDPYGTKKTHEEMAEWYNTGVVYLVASTQEGTPNPALEAASCGCVLVTTRVGNMPELVRDRQNAVFVDPNLDSLEAGVKWALDRRCILSDEMSKDIVAWDWQYRVDQFYKLFRGLVSGALPLRRPLGST